jgi:hypothetical protein
MDDSPMGTDFGAASEFKTTKVDFQRGDLLTMMVIHYGSAAHLRRVGIDVSAPVATRPSPFPADDAGCALPPGWTA